MTTENLMTLDMEFCETVSKLGATGWASNFVDHGIMLTKSGANIEGEADIYKIMKPFFDRKGNSLMWSPASGGISEAGDLGYTYGQYIRKTANEKGTVTTETGHYMTIWRETAPNKYRIEINIVN